MSPEQPSGKSILVVEDTLDTRESLAFILRHKGYEVRTAADGQEALEQLKAGARPDLILLDLMMPTMDGWEFTNRLRQHPALASIPVVVVSVVGDRDVKLVSLRPAS